MPSPSPADAAARTRKLHLGHFAFMRAVVQGLDQRDSWVRYLALEGDHTDVRTVRTTIHWMRAEFAAAARRERRHGAARLVVIDATQLLDDDSPALPALEDFAAARGLDDFSEAEQLAAYEAAYGQPSARLGRRARLIRKQLAALAWLEALVAQPPLAGDAVAAWFPPRLADPLEAAGLVTLAELVARINGVGRRWAAPIRAIGPLKAARIVDWLAQHSPSLGLPIGAHVYRPRTALTRAELAAVVAPASAIRPLEKLTVPEALDGSRGELRCPPSACLIRAGNDYEAIIAWLRSKRGVTQAQMQRRRQRGRSRDVDPLQNGPGDRHVLLARAPAPVDEPRQPDGAEALPEFLSHTQRAYRKEAERFLLWAILVRQKALSSMRGEDCEAYCAFLEGPAPKTVWCGPRARERWSPLWRPFEGPLSEAARQHAVTVLRNLYAYLVDQNYLIGNPWKAIAAPKSPLRTLDTNRSFSVPQWVFVEARLAALPATPKHHRLRVALHLLYATGLRLSEAVAARAGDLQWVQFGPDAHDPAAVDGWLLRVVGKGGRQRDVPVPYEVTSELSDYFASRGLDLDLEQRDNQDTYLLGKLPEDERAPGGWRKTDQTDATRPQEGIAESTLYNALRGFFRECAAIMAAQGDDRARRRFEKASTHWLRHTHASHALAGGQAPVEIVQQNLGHASIATTTAYIHTEQKDRLRKMQAFWGEAARRRQGGV